MNSWKNEKSQSRKRKLGGGGGWAQGKEKRMATGKKTNCRDHLGQGPADHKAGRHRAQSGNK